MQNRTIYVRSLHVLARNHLLNFANISCLRSNQGHIMSVTKKDIILPTKYIIDQQDIEILNCLKTEKLVNFGSLATLARKYFSKISSLLIRIILYVLQTQKYYCTDKII